MIRIVSGFIPIPGHPRSMEQYNTLAAQLEEEVLSKVVIAPRMARGEVADCWLYQFLQKLNQPMTFSVGDNPAKNTPAYHIVQHQKAEWLGMIADMEDDPRVTAYCWLDVGILGVPGVTGKAILEFLERAQNERSIVIPGCWGKQSTIDDSNPCWRFCGGAFVVPRRYVEVFETAWKMVAMERAVKNSNVTWEVNTMARMEQQYPWLPFWWYQADHNETMFTNYQGAVGHAN